MRIPPFFKFLPGAGFCLAVACAILGITSAAWAQDPGALYEWNFNNGDGTNTGFGSGGNLSANDSTNFVSTSNAPGNTTPPSTGNFISAGVSGIVGDQSFSAQNGPAYYYGTETGNASSEGGLNLSGGALNQFTITMWINPSVMGGSEQTFLTLDGAGGVAGNSASNGISMGLTPGWDNNGNGVIVGVNGNQAWTTSTSVSMFPNTAPTATPASNTWYFVAFVYDGNDPSNVYNTDSTMDSLYGTGNANGALITGGTGTAASVVSGVTINQSNLNPPDYNDTMGAPILSATSTLFLGSDPAATGGYSGSMDDVRIYNSLLTVSQIDDVQAEGLAGDPAAVPEPSVGLFLIGGAGFLFLLRRRCRLARA